jgi:hypothetical protein
MPVQDCPLLSTNFSLAQISHHTLYGKYTLIVLFISLASMNTGATSRFPPNVYYVSILHAFLSAGHSSIKGHPFCAPRFDCSTIYGSIE